MQIRFFHSPEDTRKVRKRLQAGDTLEGELTDETSVISPILLVNAATMPRWNYCYIPDFHRYYFVSPPESVANGLWRVSMQVDTLMTFQGDILNLSIVADKSGQAAHGDEYIDDGSLVSANYTFSQTYNFPNGFNSTPEYILITAG
ncbi:MAG: hypothetical protein IJQ81_15335 [Oscillibacter sp.]|nr:hypothetical protein [Oscillibacter sp.]